MPSKLTLLYKAPKIADKETDILHWDSNRLLTLDSLSTQACDQDGENWTFCLLERGCSFTSV